MPLTNLSDRFEEIISKLELLNSTATDDLSEREKSIVGGRVDSLHHELVRFSNRVETENIDPKIQESVLEFILYGIEAITFYLDSDHSIFKRPEVKKRNKMDDAILERNFNRVKERMLRSISSTMACWSKLVISVLIDEELELSRTARMRRVSGFQFRDRSREKDRISGLGAYESKMLLLIEELNDIYHQSVHLRSKDLRRGIGIVLALKKSLEEYDTKITESNERIEIIRNAPERPAENPKDIAMRERGFVVVDSGSQSEDGENENERFPVCIEYSIFINDDSKAKMYRIWWLLIQLFEDIPGCELEEVRLRKGSIIGKFKAIFSSPKAKELGEKAVDLTEKAIEGKATIDYEEAQSTKRDTELKDIEISELKSERGEKKRELELEKKELENMKLAEEVHSLRLANIKDEMTLLAELLAKDIISIEEFRLKAHDVLRIDKGVDYLNIQGRQVLPVHNEPSDQNEEGNEE